MNKPTMLLGAGLVLLAGCKRGLAPQAFLKAYADAAKSERVAGDYRFTTLLLSPEYLAARQMDSASPEHARQDASEYGDAHYFSVTISLAHPTGGPEDMGKDLLGRMRARGDEAVRRQLAFLQSGLGPYVNLMDKEGRKIPPVSYRFQNGIGVGAVNSFLFLFPKEFSGKPVSLHRATLVIKDFGLDTGTLKVPIRSVHKFSLKV